MKPTSIFICTLAITGLLLVRNVACAQHLHAHGNHFDVHRNVPHGHDSAGHLTDRFGHHIDGHYQHTGGIGVYENGARDYSSHNFGVYPTYPQNFGVYPTYPQYNYPSYQGYGNSLYFSLPRVYISPQLATPSIALPSSPITSLSRPLLPDFTTVLPNNIPAQANAAQNLVPPVANRNGSIKLINPSHTRGTISYKLNSFTYTINPGESQTLGLDRDWILKFDNGLGKTVTHRLSEGIFDFTVSPAVGWNIVRRIETPVDAAAPSSIANSPEVPSNQLPSQPVAPPTTSSSGSVPISL